VLRHRRLERKKDCRELIRLILKSHQGDTESLAEAPKLRGLADDHYRAPHCGDTRDIVWLYLEFGRALKNMKDVGCTIPNDADQVETFLKKLPRKYDKMRADWDNGRREYTGFNYPVTVAKAYEMAVRQVGVVAADAGDGRRVFAAARSEGDINDEIRLNSLVAKEEEQQVDSQRIIRYKAYLKTVECHLCKKKGHLKRDCPHASEKAGDDAHVYMCKFTYSDNSSGPQLPTAAHTDREQMVMEVARALPVSPQLGEWELGLDSMAGVHVCGSKRLASNIRKGRRITIHDLTTGS
jgi:hypothetical protein